jgi:SAM-dependent methyltransferase
MIRGVYHPEIYDLITSPSFLGDLEWYRRHARVSGGPVLELGAGTGRVTLAMAGDGIAVHALDASREMLARLQQKLEAAPPDVRSRVTVTHGDMRTFALADRFPLVISPYRAFLHNVTEADRRACLERVRRHLRPGGRFAFNVFHPSLEFMTHHSGALAGTWRWMRTVTRDDGTAIVCSEATRYQTVHQIVESQHRYEEFAPDGTLARTSLLSLRLAYLYPADLRQMLQEAGFTTVRISGGFDGRPVERETDELVVEATAD